MLNSRSKKFAMTLAEVLMCIGILGVIAALTLPVLKKLIPSKEESFHKKMNYVIEQVVTQLYDDESMYPRRSDFNAQGFQNLEKVTINGIDYGRNTSAAGKNSVAEEKKGKEKFCQLFASKFEKSSATEKTVACYEPTEQNEFNLSSTSKASFRAKDNVDWYLPATDFSKGVAPIMIDVNNTDGPNCLEGSTGCVNPDRFIYYVKPNGAITYQKPENVLKNKFNINVKVYSEGEEKPQSCSESKKCAIAKIDSKGKYGTFSSEASSFENLNTKEKYVIKALPPDGYYTTWSIDTNMENPAPTRKVFIKNSDVDIDLKLYKKSTHCIIVDYENCIEDEVTKCATAKIETGCGFTKDGITADQKVYQKNGDGAFEYVGKGAEGAEYGYKCGGLKDAYGNTITHETKTLAPGRQIQNADGTTTIDKTNYNNSVHVCGLTIGDYKLIVTPKNSTYFVLPKNPKKPTENPRYEQDLRLGTEDMIINVSISR